MGQPEGTFARIQLLDAAGKPLGDWSFQTGWRVFLKLAIHEYLSRLRADVVVFDTGPIKEYFAVGDGGLRLVRLEDGQGRAAQNEYVFPNFEIGMAPAAVSVDQWVGVLESSDKADVLATLVFLGGRHVAERERQLVSEPHESKYAALFLQLAGDARIRDLVRGLMASDDSWIREAAELAVRGPRERAFR
jgi:hypothetical protein